MLDFCKIKNSKVNLFPFPYIDVENYLSEEQVEDVNLNWPQEEFFKTNPEGLSIFNLNLDNLSKLDNKTKNFWLDLLNQVVYKVIHKTLSKFFDYHKFKLEKTDLLLSFGGSMLMEVNSVGSYSMNVHSHFFHDPLWLNTTLISVSKETYEGTSLFNTKNYNSYKDLDNFYDDVIRMGHIDKKNNFTDQLEEYVEYKKILFTPGKVFSFMDSPLSVHGVKKFNISKKRSRRVLRFHTCSYSSSKKLYGDSMEVIKNKLSSSEFRKLLFKNEINTLKKYYSSRKNAFEYNDISNYDLNYLKIIGDQNSMVPYRVKNKFPFIRFFKK